MKESIMVSDKLMGRAACLVEIGKPLALIDVVYQLPISEGLVLVRNDFTTICGSQLGEIDGRKGKDPYLPHLLGHESFGSVVAVGHGVKKVKANDVHVFNSKLTSIRYFMGSCKHISLLFDMYFFNRRWNVI